MKKQIIKSIDLRIATGNEDLETIKSAFTDDMSMLGKCTYDRYKIVQNCNWIPSCQRCSAIATRLRNKHTAVIFYKGQQPTRLLLVSSATDLKSAINMAMVERIGRVSLRYLLNEKGMTETEVDLHEAPHQSLPNNIYEDELNFRSCCTWEQFMKALYPNGHCEAPADLRVWPNAIIEFALQTDTEVFQIAHDGFFCSPDMSYLVALQLNSAAQFV